MIWCGVDVDKTHTNRNDIDVLFIRKNWWQKSKQDNVSEWAKEENADWPTWPRIFGSTCVICRCVFSCKYMECKGNSDQRKNISETIFLLCFCNTRTSMWMITSTSVCGNEWNNFVCVCEVVGVVVAFLAPFRISGCFDILRMRKFTFQFYFNQTSICHNIIECCSYVIANIRPPIWYIQSDLIGTIQSRDQCQTAKAKMLSKFVIYLASTHFHYIWNTYVLSWHTKL